MKTSVFHSILLLNLLACPKPVDPINPVSPVESTPVETEQQAGPTEIEGFWYDDRQDSYQFNADGTVENEAFQKAAVETSTVCQEAGFDVAACSEPRFLWRPHPKDANAFLFAIRMPLTSVSKENNESKCFCLPEPGLPMLAIRNGDSLEVNALGPDGNPIPTSGYILKRTIPNP